MSVDPDSAVDADSYPPPLLDGLVVVEHAERLSARIAGGILASLGADVTRVVYGSPERACEHMGLRDARSLEIALDRGKKVVSETANPPAARTAEILLTSSDGPETQGRHRAIASTNARVSVNLSPFGLMGDYSAYRATELNVASYGAVAAYIGEPGRPPLVPPAMIAAHQAGIAAVIAALASLRRCGKTEVDLAEADVLATNHIVGLYSLSFFAGDIPGRAGRRRPNPYPYTILPCRDGWVSLVFLAGKQWANLLAVMGNPDWGRDPRFKDRRAMGIHYADELDGLVSSWLKQFTKAELRDIAVKHKLPLAPLQSLDDLLQDRQLAHREFFIDSGTPESVRVPRLPFVVTPASGTARSRESATSTARTRESTTGVPTDVCPLTGLKVVDLSWVLSGPTVAQIFADCGADVVKIESTRRLDASRVGLPLVPDATEAGDSGALPNLMPHFNNVNRGKRSVALDVSSPGGKEVLARLVRDADVVVENFGAGSLERLGLAPEWFHNINPQLILLRISMAGQDGPDAALRGYAAQSTAIGGLDALCGYDSNSPDGMITLSLGDVTAGLYGTAAALAALRRRDLADAGATIDVSMVEGIAAHITPLLVERQRDPEFAPALDNRHATFAPHGIYRCAGDDAWVSIAVTSDENWAQLCRVLELPDPEMSLTVAERIARREQIDKAIATWTECRQADDAVRVLQQAGIAAAPVLDVQGLLVDPNNRSRGGIVDIEHHLLGYLPIYGTPFTATPPLARVMGRAPDLGEHTASVLQEAGFTTTEIERLAAEGAFENMDTTAPQEK